MTIPTRLSDAWQIELDEARENGLSDTVSANDILAYRMMFYGGAAAMLAMTVRTLTSSDAPYDQALDAFFHRIMREISEYLEASPWPDHD